MCEYLFHVKSWSRSKAFKLHKRKEEAQLQASGAHRFRCLLSSTELMNSVNITYVVFMTVLIIFPMYEKNPFYIIYKKYI